MRKRNVQSKLTMAIKLSTIFAAFSFTTKLAKADIQVINVHRNIQMSDDEPVYKDFYLNAGAESGLKQNMVVTVVRKLNIRNAAGTQSFGEIKIPVGQIKILAVQNKIAIGREYKIDSRDDLPMLDQAFMMVGDEVEMKGSFIDAHKMVYKKVAEQSVTATQSVASASGASPEAKSVENKIEPKVDVKSEAKVATKSDIKVEAKTETKSETKSDTKAIDLKADESVTQSNSPAETQEKSENLEATANITMGASM